MLHPSLASIVLVLWATSASADAVRQPVLSPRDTLQRQLADDARDGVWDTLPPLRAALVASGVDDLDRCRAYEARLQQLATELPGDISSPREQAAAIIDILHRRVLTGSFEDRCGNVAVTLDGGRYNCVTATILFVELARSMNLPCTVLHAPGHVRVRVDGPQPFELEPTCSGCLAQGKLLAWHSPPRSLAPAALVGKLYYNQGVAALERHDYAAAIAALDRSLLFDPIDRQAKKNLLAALNNGALALCEQRDFPAAQTLLNDAARLDPAYPHLAANELHLQGRWAIALCESSQHAAALRLLEEVATRHPTAELGRSGRAAVYRLWVEDLAQRGQSHAALARAEEALALFPNDPALRRLHAQLQ